MRSLLLEGIPIKQNSLGFGQTGRCQDRGQTNSPHVEIASVLVCFDHVARFVVNANDGIPIRLAKWARFFQNSAHMKTKTLPLRNLMSRPSLRRGLPRKQQLPRTPAMWIIRRFLLIPLALALACLAFLPKAQALCREGCDTPSANTFLGDDALLYNTGFGNTAVGDHALYSNTTSSDNTATGVNALYYNTGNYNTAHGYQALESNTTGTNNTANGLNALNKNTTGSSNAANGAYALYSNTTASNNMAHGYKALYSNLSGSFNTADGELALYKNTSGYNNTASGVNALYANTIGARNIALGYSAGFSLTTGSNNIDIGTLGLLPRPTRSA